jgi:hypothetical protein
MNRKLQIGIGILKIDSDHDFLNKILDSFPISPCYIGPLKTEDNEKYDFVALWDYEKQYDNAWTVCDSLIEYFFVDKYKILLSLCEINDGVTIFSTEELGHVFRFGRFDIDLKLDFSIINRKKHSNKFSCESKEYMQFMFEKFKYKSASCLGMLDLLNKNSKLENGLIAPIELILKQLFLIKLKMDKNIKSFDHNQMICLKNIFENIWMQTKFTANHLNLKNKENYLSCWAAD